MYKSKVLLRLFLFAMVFIFDSANSFARDQAALEKRLAYLSDIPEISWVVIDNNNIYIGFKERPADLKNIVNGAAVFGNRAYGFGVHVWALNEKYRSWRPGDGPYYCEATARHGKIEKSSCN